MAGTFEDRVSLSESPTRFIKQRVSDIAPNVDDDDDDDELTNKTINFKIKPALVTSVIAGGIAGVVVDIGLYPLDTFKTRLQSKEGFKASGGFRGVYKGIFPVLLASAPVSALFFATYNTIINSLRTQNTTLNPFIYLVAASGAEIICSTIRVPIEVIKQRKQISTKIKSVYIAKNILRKEGVLGFYRGFLSTLAREIPFSIIQYPLWEYMINHFILYRDGEQLTALETALCGAAAGGIAAAVTTPMDVVKTRIMLAEKENLEKFKKNINWSIFNEVYRDRGVRGLFAGITPRVLWITLGGFIYFGAYEKSQRLIEKNWHSNLPEIIEKIQKKGIRAPSYLDEKADQVFEKKKKCQNKETESECQEKEELTEAEKPKIEDSTFKPFDGFFW